MGGVVQVIIDRTTPMVIEGTYVFDRADGGTLVAPSGTTFPTTPTAGEWFWRSDETRLYRRNDANTAWEAATSTVTTHASTHISTGSDVIPIAIAGGASGLMSGTDKTKLDGYPTTVPDDTFEFGAYGVGVTTTTRYLVPGYTPNTAPIITSALRLVRAGTLKNLRVQHNLTGTGSAIIYTVHVNGVATTLTVSVNAGSVSGADTTHTVSVSADDRVELVVTKPGSITLSPTNVIATVEFNG
ncbi:MAG: hypothetical protein WC322_03100 [Candidatus Paceibacterota bacterium]|jgi:hypothetical protein